MLSLAKLASIVDGELCNTGGEEQVCGISYDSRKVKPGDVFVAISGQKDDGAKYADSALKLGAVAVILEKSVSQLSGAPLLIVSNSRATLAKAAWAIAEYPQKRLKLIGVTGTNGKTTVTTALAQLLTICGRPTGVCGTLGMSYDEYRFDSERTTAEAPDLAQAFQGMIEHGAEYVAMEATSIGLVMHRLDDLQFEVAVFTNLSRDHLDFHGSWEAYRRAKMMLFESARLIGCAVVNADDPESRDLISHTSAPILTYGIESRCDFRASDIELHADGTQFRVVCTDGEYVANTSLIGLFNVQNTLAMIATARALGLSMDEIIGALPKVLPVRGRAEVISSSAPFIVLVDYAHTPDALEKILSTVRNLAKGSLHCVIGAGGDRDKGKRPLMAQAAAKWSDRIFLTSDNPRMEDPQTILNDMMTGIAPSHHANANVDRRAAIYHALSSAGTGDVVVVAGKGHETYQEVHGVRYPFDDAEVIRDWLRAGGYLS